MGHGYFGVRTRFTVWAMGRVFLSIGTRFTVWAMGILDSEQGLQCRHFGVGLVSDLLDRLQRLIRKMRRIEGGIAS